MKFILIVSFLMGSDLGFSSNQKYYGVTFQEFDSQKSCNDAKDFLSKEVNKIKVTCTPK